MTATNKKAAGLGGTSSTALQANDDNGIVARRPFEVLRGSRDLPHNDYAERSVLGACMLHAGDLVLQVAAAVGPADFYSAANGTVFASIIECFNTTGTTDTIAVGNVLSSTGRLGEIGGQGALVDLVMQCENAAPAAVAEHCRIIVEASQRRRLYFASLSAAERLVEGGDIDAVRAAIAQSLEAAPLGGDAARTPGDVLDRWELDGPVVRQPTGIVALDQCLGGGLVFGTRVGFLGPPDAGKTALHVQIAATMAAAGVLVGMLSVDEDAEDIVGRIAQRHGFERSACERRDASTVAGIRSAIAGLPMLFYGPDFSIDSATAHLAAAAKRAGRRCALFVDSIQTATCAGERAEGTRNDAITARMRALGVAAARHRMLVVFTSETNRANYRHAERDASLSELAAAKDSGSIEYQCKVVLSLRSVDADTIELRVVKSKYGRPHQPKEPGIALAIDRAMQTLTESGVAPVIAKTGEDDLQRKVARITTAMMGMPNRTATAKSAIYAAAGMKAAHGKAAVEWMLTMELIVVGGTARNPTYTLVVPSVCVSSPHTPYGNGNAFPYRGEREERERERERIAPLGIPDHSEDRGEAPC